MRTPKAFNENLKKKIITAEMLKNCLFSVNKRAKNCRDQERKYRELNRSYNHKYDKYGNVEKYQNQKIQYYEMKDKMLSLVQPIEIHREPSGYEKVRIYDYEDEYYDDYFEDDVVWSNRYYDEETDDWVWFKDVLRKDMPRYRYYLYYQIDRNGFHTPISNPEAYPELKIVDIGELKTFGHEVADLVSIQFVKKFLQLIEEGNYTFIPSDVTD